MSTAKDPERSSSDASVSLRDAIPEKLADLSSDLEKCLAEGFFHRSEESYLRERELSELCRQWADLSSWVQQRKDSEIKVRVFNPTNKSNGYALKRTILQTCMTDQPFIFDTTRNRLASEGLRPERTIHPIVGVKRTTRGKLKSVNPLPGEDERLESVMHFELPWISSTKRRAQVEELIHEALTEVQAVVADHAPMRDRSLWFAGNLAEHTTCETPEDFAHVARVQKFLHWLVQDNFVFLGYSEFDVSDSEGEATASPRDKTNLGIARMHGDASDDDPGALPISAAVWLQSNRTIFLGKGGREADIHRPGKIDHIGLCLRDPASGDRWLALFSGLYTHKALTEDLSRIPLLKEKLDQVLREEAAVAGSHLQRKLESAFRSVPVEYLFGAEVDSIRRVLKLVISAEEDQETGVHLLEDAARRAAFVLVSLPRHRYDDDVRQATTRRLMEVMEANYVDCRVVMGTSGQVVLQFFVTARERFSFEDLSELEQAIFSATGTWSDLLSRVLSNRIEPESRANALIVRYGDAFSESYQLHNQAAGACSDIQHLEATEDNRPLVVGVRSEVDDALSGVTRIKLYQRNKIYLTDSTPVLDHFGLKVIDQSSETISTADGQTFYIDSFRVLPANRGMDIDKLHEPLAQALERTLSGSARDDSLNALILSAALSWQEVEVLRAYIAYDRQLGSAAPFATTYGVWCSHPEGATLLLRLFRSRFKPELGAADAVDRVQLVGRNEKAVLKYLEGVARANDDRIMRRGLNLVMATLRTNFWSRPAGTNHPLSLKIDCSQVDDMPAPRPYREIWVQHRHVEGIHLRGGPVARGGLRWSDRPTDFRSEILGLMDTQMVKNVLIVPVGAKGGFVLRDKYDSYAESRAAADQYYKVFIRGLLDLTDNVVNGEVTPPQGVVCYDGDDPYLVVAADKGTAHLSDTANGISAEYDFWLGDAFASGGSRGYDHKKYGITAKGAWVCVRQHFREIGIDPEKDAITAIGIGDMSGDVFGNGMLLSKTMKLLAAFDHRDIFLDPDPDPATSWQERARLFELPRSSWEDYDSKLISAGGGVFSRQSKSIKLSPEIQSMLDIEGDNVGPDDLISAILRAEVDLLWNGGIGTYVKASYETHRDAVDPGNDGLRVNANQLHARVVGEGGNLGLTHAARVEFAANEGRINADSLDNSGGVDMSDHEVNLKILFSDLERSGQLNRDDRDDLLVKVAGRVSDRVQQNNLSHVRMVSLDVVRSVEQLDDFRILLNDLEASGRLDRGRHVLPEDGELLRRSHHSEGLVRPELTKIGPFVKMSVYEDLLADPRFDTAYIERWLLDYFPAPVRKRFRKAILQHQLRREIAATMITNTLVDSMGVTHFSRLQRITGRDPVEIAYASLLATDLLDAWSLKKMLHDIRGVRISVVYVKLRHIEESITLLAQWLLMRDIDVLAPNEVLERFGDGFRSYEKSLLRIMERGEKKDYQRRLRYMRNRNIKESGSERIAGLEWLAEAGDAVLLCEGCPSLDVVAAGMLLKHIATETQLLKARDLASPADAKDGWELRGIVDLRTVISKMVGTIAERTLDGYDPGTGNGHGGNRKKGRVRSLPPVLLKAWQDFALSKRPVLERASRLANRIEGTRARGLAPALVLYGSLRALRD